MRTEPTGPVRPEFPGVRAVVAFAFAAACGGEEQSTSIVTESIRHLEVANALVGGDFAVAAADYVRQVAADRDLALSPADDFEVISIAEREPNGLRHARLQQTHAGLPVIGSDLVVHADDTTFVGMNGFLTRGLDGLDTTSALSADEAVAVAQADTDGVAGAASSRLVILPELGGQGASLAWHIEFPAQGTDRAWLWNVFVDARGGEVLQRYDAVQTAPADQASGPGLARQWTAEIDVVPDAGNFKMDTDRLRTIDYRIMMPSFGPLDAMPDPVANDAQGYGEITLAMMRDWMGHDSIDSAGMVVVQNVHQTGYCVACWADNSVHYDDGGGGYAAPASGSIDIVGHEINHGFTQFHSNLSYAAGTQSAGLNESFSSVAGIIVRHYYLGDTAGFQLAREISAGGGYSEDLCNPTFRPDYIGDARDWHPGVEVHGAGGPAGRAFCLAVGRYKASAGGGTTDGVRAIGSVWYQANAAYWTSATDFKTACEGTIDAAQSLGMSSDVVQGLRDSWADVGVECAPPGTFVCDSDGSCNAGGGETCASCPDDCGSCAASCSFWDKAKCALGIGDCSQCAGAPTGCGDGQCTGDESDASCSQDCGCQATAGECAIAPFGCWCDPTCADYGDCCADAGTCS